MESETRVGMTCGVHVAVAGERHARRGKKNINQGADVISRSGDRRCPERGAAGHAPAARCVAEVFVWVSLVLVIVLGLSRALVGLTGVDVIEIVFGDMTPAARAVYALLGAAAVYCAIAMALKLPFKGAGR